jgi:hypothetical protein
MSHVNFLNTLSEVRTNPARVKGVFSRFSKLLASQCVGLQSNKQCRMSKWINFSGDSGPLNALQMKMNKREHPLLCNRKRIYGNGDAAYMLLVNCLFISTRE